jgi:mRNA interferase MazF
MVVPSTGEVVLVPFPLSDLSASKLRPAVCLRNAGRGDWILCQVTSSRYADPLAIALTAVDFASGGQLCAAGKAIHREYIPYRAIRREAQ